MINKIGSSKNFSPILFWNIFMMKKSSSYGFEVPKFWFCHPILLYGVHTKIHVSSLVH